MIWRHKMKDSKGREISIGTRIKFLWKYDNKIHNGEIKRIQGDIIKVDITDLFTRKATANINTKLTKIFKEYREFDNI